MKYFALALFVTVGVARCTYAQEAFSSLNVVSSTTSFVGETESVSPAQSTFISSGKVARKRAPHVWFVHAGPALIQFAPNARLSVAGTTVPGAAAGVGNNTSIGVETGLFLTRSISSSLTLGIPPRATVTGAGSVSALGVIGSAKYGPAVVAVQYHLMSLGRFQPYLGGGLNYTLIYGIHDGTVNNLKMSNGVGSVLQAGSEINVNNHWGVFVDMKKIFVATNITGTVPAFGGAPAEGRLRLDPWLIHIGITYHFGKATSR